MKWIKFFGLILKAGSFFGRPIDFQKKRETILNSAASHQKERFHFPLANYLAQTRMFGTFIENITFVKNQKNNTRNIFYVDSLKIGYVRILKSGSTSLLKELLPMMDEKLSEKKLSDKEIDQLANYYANHKHRNQYQLFTLVRNPFQRLVSAYIDLFNPNNQEFILRNHLFGIFKHQMSFNDFVETLAKVPVSLLEPHFVSQLKIIEACGGLEKIRVIHLGKNKAEMDLFCSEFDLKISHSNKSLDYNYQTFYNPISLQRAFDLYKADVVALGYTDEYKKLKEFTINPKVIEVNQNMPV